MLFVVYSIVFPSSAEKGPNMVSIGGPITLNSFTTSSMKLLLLCDTEIVAVSVWLPIESSDSSIV